MTSKNRWLLILGGLLILGLCYVVHDRWRHSQLVKALRDPDPVVRMDAVRKAATNGEQDLLIEALHDEDPDIRYIATWNLRTGSKNSKTIRALLEASKDGHSYVRKEALDILRYSPAEARKFIYQGAEDDDPGIRAGAAYALIYIPRLGGLTMGGVEPPPRPREEKEVVVSLMTRLLKDDNVEVRKAAYFCLFGYHLEGDQARRVFSVLEESPGETDEDARALRDRLRTAAEQQSR
ncbi:MAG TPA: HEAT repeat domain-containing protein [Gemmataceae bacterium]|jgi:HEAT repeat protein|nr:HEAT repeat domain-containing protein [Gemmataceae bacterium]